MTEDAPELTPGLRSAGSRTAVVTSEGSLAGDELIDYVATELTPSKRPREIHFTTALPRNAMGKVQQQRLVR